MTILYTGRFALHQNLQFVQFIEFLPFKGWKIYVATAERSQFVKIIHKSEGLNKIGTTWKQTYALLICANT
jgi:hypothetical protein